MQACVRTVSPISLATLENFAPRPSSKVLRAVFFDYKLKPLGTLPYFFTAFTRGFSCDSQPTVTRRRLRCKTRWTQCKLSPCRWKRCPRRAVHPCAELTAMLHCEVMSAFSDFSLSGAAMKDLHGSFVVGLDHIRKKHSDMVKFVCNGTKQLKVIMSMYSGLPVIQVITCSGRPHPSVSKSWGFGHS